MFQKIRLQFLNNEACPVSAGANMDIIQAGGTVIKISIRESSQPWPSQSVSQDHECLSVASSHGVVDTPQCVDVWLGNSSSSLDYYIYFRISPAKWALAPASCLPNRWRG